MVNAFLHHVFIDKAGDGVQNAAGGGVGGGGEEEGCHGDVDAFITAVTTILPEKV